MGRSREINLGKATLISTGRGLRKEGTTALGRLENDLRRVDLDMVVVVKWGDDGVPGVNGSRGEAKAISVPQALWVAAVWGVIGELGVCGCGGFVFANKMR